MRWNELDNAVEVRGLCKSFGDFGIRDLDLDVPRGYIVGLIGENGAGKTTLIKCITGANGFDSGTIRLLDGIGNEVPGRVGIVFDECRFPKPLSCGKIAELMADLVPNWDDPRYKALLERFSIPLDRKVRDLSRGMSMKVQVAVAMSQGADLLIMDEATSGMDPAARDDFLDIVREYMLDEGHTVLMSSHITSDLERIADYIVFLHGGRVVLSGPKDDILDNYGVVKGSEELISTLDPSIVKGIRREAYSCSVLVSDRGSVKASDPDVVVDPATLDDIMVIIVRGEGE